MKLDIEYFKGVDKQTIDIPDRGLVRLKGPSEAGKSTILEAINWCLFPETIKNIKPLTGKTKTKVEFDIGELNVIRAKSPNRIEVNGTTDEEAEGLIQNYFNMTDTQFLNSSYVKQKFKNSILSLKPAEQLSFVTMLAFGDDNPDTYKKKINEKLTDVRSEIRSLEYVVENLNGKIQEITESNERLQSETGEIKTIDEDRYKLLKNQEKELLEKLDLVKNKKYEYLDEKNSPLRSVVKDIDLCKNRISELQNNIDNLEKPKPRTSEEKISKVKQLSEKVNIQKQIHADNEKITTQSNGATKEETETKLQKIDQAIKDQENKIQQTEQEIKILKMYQKVRNCPECKTPLHVNDDGLVKADREPDNELLLSLKERLKEEKEKHSKLCHLVQKIKDVYQMLQKIKTPEFSIDQINEYDEKCIKFMKEVNTIEKENLQYENILNNYIDETKKQKTKLESLEKKDTSELRSIDEINLDIEKSEKIIKTISEEKLPPIRKEISDIDDIREYNNKISDKVQKYNSNINIIKGYKKDIEENQNKYSVLEQQSLACNRLLDIVKNSTTESITTILDSININAQRYIEKMFPDDGTVCQLVPYHENQDGSIASKISTKIHHRGIEYNNISNFSGGAENRVMLAFQLAISDLFNSPILMLDEPLTGVHDTLRNDIYELLREVAQNKCVLVIEHDASDHLFDFSIDI